MRTGVAFLAAAVVAAVSPARPASAQSVAIDMTDMEIRNATDQRRDATVPLPAAAGYLYEIDAMVQGTSGLAALLFPNPTPLAEIIDLFEPGQSRLLYGASRNADGTLSYTVYRDGFGGELSGLVIEFRITIGVEADGLAFISFTDVVVSPFFAGAARITSGTTTVSVWSPPPAVVDEWRFDGTLDAEPGAAGQLRFLDDPAFAPRLDAADNPDGSLPMGVTSAQSAFGTVSSFGLPALAPADRVVMRTSPSYNLADPALDNSPFLPDPNLSRGVGLGLAPQRFHPSEHPDEKIGKWTMIWDVLIPASSWNFTRPGEVERFPVALIEDNYSNNEQADAFIQIDSGGDAGVGYTVETFDDYIRSASLAPDQWMRLAIVSDGYSTETSRVFINGSLIGVTGGDWVYNAVDPSDPRYSDGTPVEPATWAAWGEFPNPWGQSPGDGTPLAGTLCLFADLPGRGQPVYIANLAFVDALLTDGEIAALGGPSASGIFIAPPADGACCLFAPGCPDDCFIASEGDCAAAGGVFAGGGTDCSGCASFSPCDWNGDGAINTADFFEFFAGFFGAPPSADYDGSGGTDTADFFGFFGCFFAVPPGSQTFCG